MNSKGAGRECWGNIPEDFTVAPGRDDGILNEDGGDGYRREGDDCHQQKTARSYLSRMR